MKKVDGKRGFTLIEVIVAVVISAIAMAAILPFLGRVFQLSHEPRTTLQAGLSLQSAMERLVARDMEQGHDPALLSQYVGAGSYEGQAVMENRFVTYVNGQEGATTDRELLKIVLRNPETGETMTRLFAVPP